MSRLLSASLLTAGVLGMVLVSRAQEADAPPQANSAPAEPKAAEPQDLVFSEGKAPSEADLRKALMKKVPVDFRDDPLFDVMKIIAKATDANILVDERALSDAGVRVDEGVTMKGPPLEAARLLDRILEPLALTWVIQDHVVHITTILAAEEMLSTVTYPVGDLLEYAEKHQIDPLAAAEAAQLHLVQFGDGKAGGVIPGVGCCFGPICRAAWLIDLIQNLTSGPWEDIDGTGGSISLVKNNLVIRQTHLNHQEITKILKTIRDFTQGELKGKAVRIVPPHYAVEEDEKVKEALKKVVSSIKLRDTPLKDFVEYLGKNLGFAVAVDEAALADGGIHIDVPLNFDFKNLPVDSILKTILESLNLCHFVHDGRLIVTSQITAEEQLHAVISDVRDLDDENDRGTALVDTLQNETSGPWEDIDGTGGQIEIPIQGLMVVRQTDRVHEEIAAILADLRKSAEAEAKTEPEPPADPEAVTVKFYPVGQTLAMQLKEVVPVLVERDTWSKNGGEGIILIVNNLLVVKTKNSVHDKVRDFLQEIQKANAAVPFLGGGGFGGSGLNGQGAGMGGPNGGRGFFRVPPGQAGSR